MHQIDDNFWLNNRLLIEFHSFGSGIDIHYGLLIAMYNGLS